MQYPIRTETIEHLGVAVRIEYFHDDDAGMPWENSDDPDDENVRDIYLHNVLKMGLPIDDNMRAFMADRYTAKFLNSFESWGTK